MPLYYPGYSEAKASVATMSLEQLLNLIDDLYGRDNLKFGDTVEDVRAEAYRQIEREFTDTSSKEYKDRDYWRKIGESMRGHGYLILLVLLLVSLLAGPVAAQDDGSAPRLPEGPGFAIGAYENGHSYALAQTFTLRHGGTFDGAVIAFAETTGAPCGAVRWEIRRWWAEYGVMGRLLATGAWEPAEMHFNTLPSAGAKLRPGSYALVLRSVSEQEPGNYWNVIASDGTRDIYAGGELLQLQADGGAWGSWDGQDIIGELALVGPDVMFVELVG
jgi:hypothetical protein